MSEQPTVRMTVKQLESQLGMNGRTISKWLAAEGIEPVDGKYDLAAAEAASLPHRTPQRTRSDRGPNKQEPVIDPKTGLPWHVAEIREKTLEKRRENERQEKLASKELMLTIDHHAILGAIVSRIEQIPGKLQSEAGLSGPQVIALRRALDEAREAAAKEIENENRLPNPPAVG